MLARSKISSVWKNAGAAGEYACGVSLHSHTSMSEETLSFIHKMFVIMPMLKPVFAHYERQSVREKFPLDFVSAHWRPPLQPKMAFDLEAGQIQELGLSPLVSITDHDTISAPMLLRTVASSRHIPVSVEWSVPYGGTEFHVGVHNLPTAQGAHWMEELSSYTRMPGDAKLYALLHELDAMPGVLVVLNHPIWDLQKVGAAAHHRELMRLLDDAGECFHALELNGLRSARENRVVAQLARETGHLLISGGDRHGMEPNANINLTNAVTFREFVDEIRIERQSHVLFMEQYAKPWEQRMLHSTLDAVTDYPEFMEGWRNWDDRAFHRDRNGEMRPLSQLWPDGKAPLPLRAAIQFVRLARSRTFTQTFSLALRAHNPEAEMELL